MPSREESRFDETYPAICRLFAREAAVADKVVGVRQRLTEGKGGLHRIKGSAREDGADEIHGGAGFVASVVTHLQPIAVMLGDRIEPVVQAMERQIVGRKDEHVIGQMTKTVETGEKLTQRVAIWFVVEHADMRGDARQHLIASDHDVGILAIEARVFYYEPEGDPLRLFLNSLERFRHLPDDVLALPSHNLPFRGLHDRLNAIAEHHHDRLEMSWDACATPRSGVELSAVLFNRRLDPMQASFVLGETLAHANYLVADGRLAKQPTPDDRIHFIRAD